MSKNLRYFIIYKPFGMLSQFKDENNRPCLGELHSFPKDVYPVGRLDADSEGLLLLTNDTQLNHRLLNPKFAHERQYLVQVEGLFDAEAKQKIEKGGLALKNNKKPYLTLPAKVELMDEPSVTERNPPIRFRKNIPTSWILMTLKEGKNRQVRKMTANVGFPTLRLIRVKIENLSLGDLQPSQVLELSKNTVIKALFQSGTNKY